MNIADVTEVVAATTGVLTGLALPVYANRKKAAQVAARQAANAAAEAASKNSLTTESVARMFKDDRDDVRARMDRMALDHQAQIDHLKAASEQALAAVEAKWRAQHEHDQAQIAQLRQEIDTLYRRLYQTPPQQPPLPT